MTDIECAGPPPERANMVLCYTSENGGSLPKGLEGSQDTFRQKRGVSSCLLPRHSMKKANTLLRTLWVLYRMGGPAVQVDTPLVSDRTDRI